MLARVADNLFWLGRYIERTETLCRHLNIQYFSTLDAPFEMQKDIAFQSVLGFVGVIYNKEQMQEEDVLMSVAMDEENSGSIKSSVHSARENARGVRDLISIELWNSMNKFYRFVYDYSVDYFKTRGLDDFTSTVVEHCSIIRSNIDDSLLRDQVWAFIKLGIHIERAVQISQILTTKLPLVSVLRKLQMNKTIENFQWATLLRSSEGFDMFRRLYGNTPQERDTLDFFVLNKMFPRSISYNVTSAKNYLQYITTHKRVVKGTAEWCVGKLSEELIYKTIEDFEENPMVFLQDIQDELYKLNTLLSEEFLNY